MLVSLYFLALQALLPAITAYRIKVYSRITKIVDNRNYQGFLRQASLWQLSGSDAPIHTAPAVAMYRMACQIGSRPLAISINRMSPKRMQSSERKRIMAAPEAQMKRPCCCSSQKRKARRADGRQGIWIT